LVQTVDFFTPIVDDPYMFGQIAAANALSDVYAMGGTPLTAMNLVAFPIQQLELEILRETLRGGIDKLREAETVLVGGHSIEDNEFKYGLSVTGVVHPSRVLTNTGAQQGDRLILTKPIGTGIINTALKGDMAAAENVQRAMMAMATLNRTAAEIMNDFTIHACTDVTGFGLLGHMLEMVGKEKIAVRVDTRSIPVLPGADEYALMGLVPGGTYRNRDFYSPRIDNTTSLSAAQLDILFDPQTSGGLLMACGPDDADLLLSRLRQGGVIEAAVIAEVLSSPAGRLILV